MGVVREGREVVSGRSCVTQRLSCLASLRQGDRVPRERGDKQRQGHVDRVGGWLEGDLDIAVLKE